MNGFGMITGLGIYGARCAPNATAGNMAISQAARSQTKANEAQRVVSVLEERIDKLLLVNMAVWELLKERTSLAEEDLMNKVHEIDIRDGVVDGKITEGIKKCRKCDRTMSQKHRRCLYCGAEDLKTEAYDAAK